MNSNRKRISESDDSTEDLILKEETQGFTPNGTLTAETPYLNYVVEMPNRSDTSLWKHINKCLVIVVLILISLSLLFICLYMHAEHKLQTQQTKYKIVEQSKYCTTASCVTAAAFLKTSLEESINPCDDFYLYSCGGWLQKHPIPDGKIVWAIETVLNDELENKVKRILENSSITEETKLSKAEYNVYKFYRSCKDMKTIKNLGATPLTTMMMNVGKFATKQNNVEMLTKESLTSLLSKYYQHTLSDAIFSPGVSIDDRNSTNYILKMSQSGLALSLFRYKENKTDKVVNAYIKYLSAIAIKLGTKDNLSEVEIQEIAEESYDFEHKLSEIFVPPEKLSTIEMTYNKKTLKELTEMVPMIDWVQLGVIAFKDTDVQITDAEPVVLITLGYFEKLNDLLKKTSKRVFNNYLLFRMCYFYASFLTQEYQDLSKGLLIAINGVYSPAPRWKQCISSTEAHMGMALSALFVKEHFSGGSYGEANSMVKAVRESFKEGLSNLDWMDKKTVSAAISKADSITQKIGYPTYIMNATALDESFKGLSYDKKTYFDNIMAASAFGHHKAMKRLREQVDRSLWAMTPMEINAYYNPSGNEIVFTAAIMQPPYFKHDYPKAVNYGRMGSIIGHEMTHGFDNDGRLYDKDGNFRAWWSTSSETAFNQRAKCFVQEYSNFTLQGIQMKGNTTLGENIADNGGLKAAYRAYKTWTKRNGEEQLLPGVGLTNDEVFFISYAQSWCSGALKSRIIRQVNQDPHSPAIERVRGVIMNNKDFADIFKCPLGSQMNPKRKCAIW